jgi:Nitroreductase family
MDVYEAVDTRRAVRAFSDKPVPKAVLERVLAAATREIDTVRPSQGPGLRINHNLSEVGGVV